MDQSPPRRRGDLEDCTKRVTGEEGSPCDDPREMLRLAHFSDIHLTADPLGWERGDWFNKRLPGWINLRWLGRGRRFRTADDVVEAMTADLRRRRPDHLIFSGDATALGFESEFARAAE